MSAVTREALRLPRIRRRSSPDGLDRLRRRDLADFLRTEMRHHDATKALLRDTQAAAVEQRETASTGCTWRRAVRSSGSTTRSRTPCSTSHATSKGAPMGDIGPGQREYEVEPLTTPATPEPDRIDTPEPQPVGAPSE